MFVICIETNRICSIPKCITSYFQVSPCVDSLMLIRESCIVKGGVVTQCTLSIVVWSIREINLLLFIHFILIQQEVFFSSLVHKTFPHLDSKFTWVQFFWGDIADILYRNGTILNEKLY